MAENNKKSRNLKGIRYISEGSAEKTAIKEREKQQRREEEREKRRTLREKRKNEEIINRDPPSENLPKKTFKWTTTEKKNRDPKREDSSIEVIPRKKNNLLIKIACGILAFILLVFGINLLMPMGISESIQHFISGIGGGNGFPVSISAATTETIVSVGDDTALLTDSTLILYKQNGKVIYNRQHGFSNPAVCSGGNRALVYDRDGNRIRIENRAETLYQMNFEDKIITADVAEKGSFAIVTTAEEYLCKVTVYNKKAEQVFVWNSAERRVTAVSLSSNGKYLALGTVKAFNGVFCSEIIIFNIKKSTQPIVTETYEQSAVMSLDYKSKGAVCILDNMASFVTAKGVRTDYIYDSGEPIAYSNGLKGAAVVLRRYNNANNNTLVSFDNKFKVRYETPIEREVIGMSMCGTKATLLHKGELSSYNRKGEQTYLCETRSDSDIILSYKHHAMVLTTTSVESVKLK